MEETHQQMKPKPQLHGHLCAPASHGRGAAAPVELGGNVGWEQSEAVPGVLRPPTFARARRRGPAACPPHPHTKPPDLVTATSGRAPGPASAGTARPRPPHPPPAGSLPSPPRGQLSLGGGGAPAGTRGAPGTPDPPGRPRPPPSPAARRGTASAASAGRATHLHSSGNSAPWALAAPGAPTSSSSCSASRERSGRPAGAGPRWALRPAAAPIARGPGGTAGAGLAARGCRGPRPGHGCAASVEADRSAGGAGAE